MKIFVLTLILVLFGGCSLAQFTAKDARWAAEYAKAKGDLSWAGCMSAVADEMDAAGGVKGVAPPGLLGAVTVLKEVYDSRNASQDALETACAKDAVKFMKFGVKLGAGAFPGGGSLGTLFGF